MANQVSLLQTIQPVNGVYAVNFSINNKQITPYFSSLLAEYGEPTITIGGTYNPTSPTPAFTLDTTVYRLISDLPIVYNFDPNNPAFSAQYIQQQVTYFASQFVLTFNTAVTTLLASSDTISGQTIINFPTS